MLFRSIHWSYIFFINVPIGLICVFLCLRYMHVEENLSGSKGLDYAGVLFMFIMMFALIYYLNKGQDIGWMSNEGMLLMAITFLAAGLLFWWEQRVSDPLVSMRLIKDGNILKANMITMVMFMAMAGSYLLLPYYLAYVKGMETIQYGFVLIANSVGMMASGPAVGRITDRTGDHRVFIIAGTLTAAFGFFLMMGFSPDTSLAYILLALFIMGAGMGMALVSCTSLAYGYIRPEENSQLSGQTTTFRQAGSSIGVAVLNATFMANLAYGAVTVAGILEAGFKHAFFVAVVMALFGFVLAMSTRNAKDASEETQ